MRIKFTIDYAYFVGSYLSVYSFFAFSVYFKIKSNLASVYPSLSCLYFSISSNLIKHNVLHEEYKDYVKMHHK
jgi:hypothetical protein